MTDTPQSPDNSDAPLHREDLTTHHARDKSASARPQPDPASATCEQFAGQAARLLADYDCTDVLLFDVRGLSPITNFVIIASGTSDRQIKALGAHVEKLGEATGFDRYGEDADKATTWLALDFVEVMVHLFEPETRAHYDLEMLWGDAPKIDWQHG